MENDNDLETLIKTLMKNAVRKDIVNYLLEWYPKEAVIYYLKYLDDRRYYDFSGQKCGWYTDTYCEGWNGISNRCVCGNMKVLWEWNEDEKKLIAVEY